MKLFRRLNSISRNEASASHLAVGALLVITILYSATML